MKNFLRQGLKTAIYAVPGARRSIQSARLAFLDKTLRLRCYLYDFRTDRRHIGWKRHGADYWRLSSELIFYHHKLEKGLCLPSENQRFFGMDAAHATFRLMKEWRAVGLDTEAPVYRAAKEVLGAWRRQMDKLPPPEAARTELFGELDALAVSGLVQSAEFQTPIALRKAPDKAFEMLKALAESRRSVRNFTGEPVDFALVERAAAIAQLSPSACNRQPWKLHFYDDRARIDHLLTFQNGNRGFGHTVPLLAIVTAEYRTFFDSSERMEPVLDGGLFLMSFILALQAQGLSSCCLNWCVQPEVDRKGHEAANIPPSEKILTYLAIGKARDGTITPLSPRRPLTDVIHRHRSGTV